MFNSHPIKAMAIGGAIFILLVLFGEWKNSLLLLIVFLSIAWILILLLAFKSGESTRSVTMLLGSFRRKVDHASQQRKAGVKIDDQLVLKAFDELNAEINALLQAKKVDIARLKSDVLTFLYTGTAQSVEWRPPSLRELGYLIDICKCYANDAPVLALYKFSAKESNGDGCMVATYAILSEDTALSFPPTICVRVESPHLMDSVDIDSPRSSHNSASLASLKE